MKNYWYEIHYMNGRYACGSVVCKDMKEAIRTVGRLQQWLVRTVVVKLQGEYPPCRVVPNMGVTVGYA